MLNGGVKPHKKTTRRKASGSRSWRRPSRSSLGGRRKCPGTGTGLGGAFACARAVFAAFGLQLSAVRRCCFLGSCSFGVINVEGLALGGSFWLQRRGFMFCQCSARIPFSVGLQHFGEREGLSEQRALGCFRFHANLVALRVLPTLQNGVSVLGSRWGGSACFALALQVAVAFVWGSTFGLLCPCWGVEGINPGLLVLAFSTRTLKRRGVPARRVQAGGFCVGGL